jgi:hypothetical protein
MLLDDGPKLVRELFRVADELSPSIVFIGAAVTRGTCWSLGPVWVGGRLCSSHLVACWPQVLAWMQSCVEPQLGRMPPSWQTISALLSNRQALVCVNWCQPGGVCGVFAV